MHQAWPLELHNISYRLSDTHIWFYNQRGNIMNKWKIIAASSFVFAMSNAMALTNPAYVFQFTPQTGALGGEVQVYQQGSNNYSNVNQDSAILSKTSVSQSGGFLGGSNNSATVNQNGNISLVDINQSGNGHSATSSQNGDWSVTEISQSGLFGNSATTSQNGDFSKTAVSQSGLGLNNAVTTQNGDAAVIVVRQNGASNYASSSQNANFSYSNVNQIGLGNVSFVSQN